MELTYVKKMLFPGRFCLFPRRALGPSIHGIFIRDVILRQTPMAVRQMPGTICFIMDAEDLRCRREGAGFFSFHCQAAASLWRGIKILLLSCQFHPIFDKLSRGKGIGHDNHVRSGHP